MRVIVGLIGGGYIAYIIRLITTHNTAITGADGINNYILMGICLIIALLFLINTLYQPLIQKRTRLTIALVGLAMVILAHYTMFDTPENMIYLADVTKLFGVIILVGGATGAVIPTDIIQEIKESKIEVIEA